VTYDKERYANDPVYQAKLKTARNAWCEANRPSINARRRHRLATDPKVAEAMRRTRLRRKYGLSLEDYDAMVARQDGLCPLCRRMPKERLCVDHCHDTQMLRLLLCHGCNRGLGNFGHDPALMRGGADYLEIWQIIHARRRATAASPTPEKNTSKPEKEKPCPRTSSPKKKTSSR